MTVNSLSDDAIDFIKESFNLAMGRVTKEVSLQSSQKIKLSIPQMKVHQKFKFSDFLFNESSDKFVLIHQPYMGKSKGHCFLIYDLEYSIEILKKLFDLECVGEELSGNEKQTLLDFSNIVFSECLDEFEKILEENFLTFIPELDILTRAEVSETCQVNINPYHSYIHLSMTFSTESIDSSSQLNFLVNSSDLEEINSRVSKHLEKIFSA